MKMMLSSQITASALQTWPTKRLHPRNSTVM